MRQRLVVLCMFVAALSISRVAIAENPVEIAKSPICYVMIDGIPDDSAANRNHEIEVLRVSYGAHIVTGGAAGGAAGRSQQEGLIITKLVSAATPKLFQEMLTGRLIKSVQINFVRSSEKGVEVYYTLKLDDVMLSNIHQFSDGSRFLEDVSMTANRIEIVYNSPNKPSSPVRFDFKTLKLY